MIVSEWTILEGYSYEAVEIISETEKTVLYKAWNYDRTRHCERRSQKALDWRGAEEQAVKLSAQLTSAQAEKNRRQIEARKWFEKRKAELLAEVQP